MTKLIHKKLITDSRSYNGISTLTDHKLVKAQFKLEWWKMRKQHSTSVKINIDKLREPETATVYKEELDRKLTASNDDTPEESPHEAWDRIAKVCREMVTTTLVIKEPNRRAICTPIIRDLSTKQKKTQRRCGIYGKQGQKDSIAKRKKHSPQGTKETTKRARRQTPR